MDRILWPLVAGSEAARLRPDQLAVLVVATPFLRRDTGGGERASQTHFVQFANRVGLKIDAGACRADCFYRFKSLRLDTRLPEAERHRQSADASADDDCFH